MKLREHETDPLDPLGCWCYPYRDDEEPEVIIHQPGQPANVKSRCTCGHSAFEHHPWPAGVPCGTGCDCRDYES